jgi:hypothetical protein
LQFSVDAVLDLFMILSPAISTAVSMQRSESSKGSISLFSTSFISAGS